jgi:hypothetical protein
MIEPGRLRQPDLAHDLRPQMKRRAGLPPGRIRQVRPCSPICMSLRYVILRRDDVINELGKRERDAALSACLSNIHQRQIPSKECILLGLISTETVNSTVKVACEGLKAVIRRKLGDTSRLTRHGIFLFLLG